ncbi:MAG: sigma-70 family RNA polymerase sigma factor [Acidobacteria bacterium]|nr:sigma-70 family RNA polymerase sigma factor [Acidobacteriota bacterium]
MNGHPIPLSEISEQDLVRRAQSRDEAAFQELIRRTASTSMRLALSIVKNRQEAEDQVQNSVFKAWQAIGSFRSDAKFSTWLGTIVTNHSLMQLRASRRAPLSAVDDRRDDGPALEPADHSASHETVLGDREMADRLRRELRLLPPLFREILDLRDLQELPTGEVASRLGISEAAAKSRLARARQMLRQRMERHSAHATALFA